MIDVYKYFNGLSPQLMNEKTEKYIQPKKCSFI